MPNFFDEVGFKSKGYNEVRNELAETAKIAFADKLDGKQLRIDDSSVLGRLFGVIALPIVQNADIIPLILQSLDINQAEGQQLDNLLWNIHRIKRRNMGQSSGLLMLYGTIGATVPVGSEVGNGITGDAYSTTTTVKFSNVGANGVDIEITNIDGKFTLQYTVDGKLSTSPSISVQKGRDDTTISQIADRVVDAINSQSSYLSATKNNDNSVKVQIKDSVGKSYTGSFTTTGNMKIVRSYMPVLATSTTYSSSESLADQVTKIRTPVLGWLGVTNPFYIFPSSPIESDEEYRHRAKLNLHGSPLGKFNAILFALKSVRGVTYENVQVNSSPNATSSGIVNNGVAITVQGGDENEIALAIFNSISEGIMTSGDIVKEVKDINGFGHEIRFSRPKPIALQISMSLVTYPDFPTNGNTLIKQAIVEWFNNLNVGDDIHYSRLFEPVNTIKGFAVRNLKFGRRGGTMGSDDVVIKHNELATISAEDISIGGN